MTEPNFKLFPVIEENIAKASIEPNTTYNEYLAWLTKFVDTLKAPKLKKSAELCCKSGLYSTKKWQQEKDDKLVLITSQTKVAQHLYNGKPLHTYKRKTLKQKQTRKKPSKQEPSDNDEIDSLDINFHPEEDDDDQEMTNNNNNTDTNINNNNNINIQDLVNNPQFINAIKSISGSNTTFIS